MQGFCVSNFRSYNDMEHNFLSCIVSFLSGAVAWEAGPRGLLDPLVSSELWDCLCAWPCKSGIKSEMRTSL